MECSASDGNGHVFDLSPLIKADGHHMAITTASNGGEPDATYYINVCRPLNPIDSTLCPPLSSACAVTSNKDKKRITKVCYDNMQNLLNFYLKFVEANFLIGSKSDAQQKELREI